MLNGKNHYKIEWQTKKWEIFNVNDFLMCFKYKQLSQIYKKNFFSVEKFAKCYQLTHRRKDTNS